MVSSYESWGRRAEEKAGTLAKERDAFLAEAQRQRDGWAAAQKENSELSEQLKIVTEQRDRLQADLDNALAGREEAAQKACEDLRIALFRLRDEFTRYLNAAKARRAAELMYNQVVGSLQCADLFLEQDGGVTEDVLEAIKADEAKYREELVNSLVAILPESFRVPILMPSDVDATFGEVDKEACLPGEGVERALVGSPQGSDPTSSSSSEG